MIENLGVGDDISKIRSRIEGNFPFLEDSETDDKINQLIIELTKSEESGNLLSDILTSFSEFTLLQFYKSFLISVCLRIAYRPFRIACTDVYAVELIDFLENGEEDYSNSFLDKLFRRKILSRLPDIVKYSYSNQDNSAEKRSFLRETFAEEPQDSRDFPTIFTYTLRQTAVSDMYAFLSNRQRRYRGDFHQFLEFILIDDSEESLIATKQKLVIKKWLTSQSSIENKPNYLPELPVPNGWVTIPGRLKEKAIKQFFSFLFLETNSVANGHALLTREEVEQLLKYGFAYPLKANAGSKFTLNTGRGLSNWFVYHMFYELYQAHKKISAPQDYKDHFALFLKHRFTNFENLSLGTLKNSLRERRDIKARRRDFDITTYLPVRG